MTEELDVLRIISERLRAADVPFMLTGSFALGYYGKPRMTRDLDFVVALMERHVDALVSAFSTDFYIDEDAARSAIKSQRMFNLMHLDSAIKVDLIVRKNSEYRHVEFERRKSVEFAGVSTWITSREDLILSKLVWASDSGSQMQLRDVRTLIDELARTLDRLGREQIALYGLKSSYGFQAMFETPGISATMARKWSRRRARSGCGSARPNIRLRIFRSNAINICH